MDTVIADFEMFLKIKLDERYKYTKGSKKLHYST